MIQNTLLEISHMKLIEDNSNSKLTILSMGLGQDSFTILLLLIFDKDFRKKYAPNDLIIIFSDTGNEHPETYKFRDEIVIPLCKKHNLEFVTISNDMGYHGNTWQSLTHQWENGKATVGSMAYPKTCTHNLKLNPQYKYVEELLPKRYKDLENRKRKANFTQFAKYHGKIKFLVGIAKGEESRVADAESETALWKKQSVVVEYPLIDVGFDRQSCQDYIKAADMPLPIPSNCMFCPFGCNHMELLWLEKSYPDRFDEWCEFEQRKLDAHKDAERNLGVSARLHKEGNLKGQAFTLKDMLKEAKEKYSNVTLSELNEYKWSHGHCVNSKY